MLLEQSDGDKPFGKRTWISKLRRNVNVVKETIEDGRIYPNEFDDELANLKDYQKLMDDVLSHPLLTDGRYFSLLV